VHGIYESKPPPAQLIKCTQCSFSHRKASVVRVHISKSHWEGSSLQCDYCDYSCISRSGMLKHKSVVHKDIDLVPPPSILSTNDVNTHIVPAEVVNDFPSCKEGSNAAPDSSAPIVICLARLTLYRMLTPLYYREKVKVA
jgi:hypothetical protein